LLNPALHEEPISNCLGKVYEAAVVQGLWRAVVREPVQAALLLDAANAGGTGGGAGCGLGYFLA
jgi:hypothetical protein